MANRRQSHVTPAGMDAESSARSLPDLQFVSRRAVLKSLAAGGTAFTLSTMLPGSTPGARASRGLFSSYRQETDTAEIKRGGRIVEASVLANPGWDVHLSNVGGLTGYGLVYNTLLRYELVDPETATFELRPGLAERWEQPDPQTVELHLRQGVTFHDGSEFNADVAKWNLERIAQNPKASARTQMAPLDEVEVVDPYVIRLKLNRPSPAMLLILSDGTGYTRAMMSRDHFEAVGETEFNRNPSGTGPMRLQSWVQDDRAVLEPFEDYWEMGADGQPLPYLDEFVSRFIPDLTTALVDLQAGGVDVVIEIPPKDVPIVQNTPGVVYEPLPWWGVQYFTLGFNTKVEPFGDPKVRQALLHSFDREGIAKAIGFGVAEPQYYPYWGENTLGYDETIPKNEFDLDRARELLTEAGFPNGFETTLNFIRREPDTTAAEYQQQIWAEIGVNVTIRSLERLAWLDEMAAGNFELASWRAGIDLDPELNTRVTTDASANFSSFSDPEIDRLMEEGNSTLDVSQRQEIYAQVVRRIQEEAWIGSGYVIPYNFVRREGVHGVIPRFSGVSFREAWVD